MIELKYEPSLEPNEKPMLTCPVCGSELNRADKVYKKIGGSIVGCQYCMDWYYAGDVI